MFDLLIRGGLFFGMTEEGPRPASIGVKDGKVSAILPPGASVEIAPEKIFRARGLYVCPGFVDTHIHDERFEDPDTVQHCLIAQGVTTAVAGNCGSGPLFKKSQAARPHPWLHLSYLVGNRVGLREEVGHTDRYTPATPAETAEMCSLLRESLKQGAMGLSLGLEYAPGASWEEISALAAVTAEFGRIVTVHIRYDDDRSVDAVREVIRLSRENGVRLQVSHLGSMTMGHTRECEELIEEAIVNDGVDVGFDCYPYDAFCASAGSAVYDDGFVERWKGKGPECLEAVSGRFKGNRLTFETLAEMRREEPGELIAAHVMDRTEIENCIANPRCIVASDALATKGGAHPRIAGTFPRALGILRRHGYSWEDALRKMTALPADRMKLDAGRLYEGATADIAVFDPDEFVDRATFRVPYAAPDGLKLVVINGQVALKERVFYGGPNGEFSLARV